MFYNVNCLCPSPKKAFPVDSLIQEMLDPSPHSLINNLCMRVILSFNPIERYKKTDQETFPEEWRNKLKKMILNEPDIIDSEQQVIFPPTLTNSVLDRLLYLGISRVSSLLKNYPYEWQLKIVGGEPFQIATLIRDMLEQNSTVDAVKLATEINSILELSGRFPISEECLSHHIQFMKDLSQPNAFLPIEPTFRLIIFTAQIGKSFLNQKTLHFVIQDLMRQYSNSNTVARLRQVTEMKNNSANGKIDYLYLFMLQLQYLCMGMEKKVFLDLFQTWIKYVEDFNVKNRSNELILTATSIWSRADNLLYSIPSPFMKIPAFQEGYKILNGLPLLTSRQDAVAAVQKNDKLHPATAFCIYHSWWFKKEAPLNRLIDWLMHDLLVEKQTWGLEEKAATQIIKDSFRIHYSIFPFNSFRAHQAYHTLHSAKKKQI